MKDKRLDRLMPALSAKERAILMLRDLKAGKPQDRQLLQTAPEGQTRELNRLIGLMNAANGDLAHVISNLRERALKEEQRFHWLQWARICALEMWAVRTHYLRSGREAITESEFRQREEQARAELISLDDCALLYTEDYHAWEDDDYETDADGDLSPTDEAWYRVRDAKLAELRALVADGAFPATGNGKRQKITRGAFYDWLGQPVPVSPAFGIAFDVQPDHREREVARSRRDHDFMRQLLDRGACAFDLPLDMEAPLSVEPPKGGFGLELARILAVQIRAAVSQHWQELQAIEEQIDGITAEFDGEDVLTERGRGYLDDAMTTLLDLREQLQKYTGPFELPEPDVDVRATVQRIVDNEVAHVPTR